MKFLKTEDRFGKPSDKNATALSPNTTRNIYALFGDGGQDLFRHGLAELTPDSNNESNSDPEVGKDRLSNFKNTANYPYDSNTDKAAKEDPVMFGFDVIIRSKESPLFSDELQDSVKNFFTSDASIGNVEMLSRQQVWMDFKKDFFQFFRQDLLDNKPFGDPTADNPSNSRFYYYLKKVSGLENLVEGNSSDAKKSFIDYGKDVIKLEFTEDVTLRIGQMAQRYKNLYWSRLNGKTMIPENLLRFDCDIVVSEVRNFVKVKKALDTGKDLQILRDNVNRYVYSLYECQLFFDKNVHPGEIDLGAVPVEYDKHTVGFNYKFSTLRLDVFDPGTEAYVPLNNGTYDPYSVTPFDKFINVNKSIDSSSGVTQSISNASVGSQPQIEIEVIKYNDSNIITNSQTQNTNSNISDSGLLNQPNTSVSDLKSRGQEGDSIDILKKSISDIEIGQFKNSISGGYITQPWGRTKVPGVGDIAPDESSEKSDTIGREIDDAKAGAPKESWLNSDTPAARFVKRIANTGIAVVNQVIASRVSLLNKTINNIAGGVLSNRIQPPVNIYQNDFNGQFYLASKLVKESLYKFAGESISSLFNK